MDTHSVAQEESQPLTDFSTCVEHESWTRQQLEEYQAHALQACRTYAYTHSPFYQRFHQGLMERPLQELPVLTKAMVMEHFDELVTDREVQLQAVQHYLAQDDQTRPFLNRYRLTVTSGSTGQPGIFLSNRVEGSVVANTLTRVQTWGGVTARNRVAAVVSPLPAHITSQFPVLMLNGQKVPYIQLSTTLAREVLVDSLNEWQPDVLFAYPSIVSLLADEQRRGRLHIPLRVICCAGETLADETRRSIEETWQEKLFNTYGATETGLLAGECLFHQGLHLFEDFSIVEVVDKDNRPVPPGEVGEKVLLTALARRTQPLIRYEVSDRLRISTREPCPCGRPFARLESIEGRTGQGLYFASTRGGEEQISILQFETIFDPLPISGWQIVQEADELQVLLTGTSEELHDEQVCDLLQQVLIKQGVIVPAIKIQRVTALTRNAVGKSPTLISHI